MAKHTVRIPSALWDEWQPKFSPEEGALLIPGMLATAGGQSLQEIAKALQVTKFEVLGGDQRASDIKADQRALLRGNPDVPAARGDGGDRGPCRRC